MAGYALPPAQAKALALATEGIPLSVVETVRSDAIPPIFSAVDAQLVLPAKVQAVIDYRLAQLSPLALSLAGLASAIGRRFALALVVAASGQPEAEVLQGLDELSQRRIVLEVAGGVYDFSHDKTARGGLQPVECILAAVSPSQSGRGAHAAGCRMIRQRSTPRPPFIFNKPIHPTRLWRCYVHAADVAADLHAIHRAAQLYGRCVEIAGKLNLPTATLIQIYTTSAGGCLNIPATLRRRSRSIRP